MESIKRVLVAVDLTEMDETLVRYIVMLSNAISFDKVYFLNVMKSMQYPEKVIEKYPDLLAPMDEAAKNEIQYTITHFSGNQFQTDYEIEIKDGHRVEKILKWAKVKEVDLIVLGRKSGFKGEGIVSSKIVNLAPCSVILVPEVLPESLQKILVPLDYLRKSETVIEFSLNMASNISGLEITCLNIYDVPTGYHASGRTYEEFAEIMKHNAEDSFNECLDKYDTKGIKIEAIYELDENRHVAEKIYQISIKERVSAIVIESKSRTQAAAMLLGSMAEKLIKLNSQIPLIIVKDRKHNMGFFEALLKI